jgi:hypothetical protein
MSRIMFCATPEGMRRQVLNLTNPRGEVPQILKGGQDVLDAILALEVGRDVVADARSAATGWRLPEGVEIGFDPDMAGGERQWLREQCEARALLIAPLSELIRVNLSKGPDDTLSGFLRRKVVDPFGPHVPLEANPEAA